MWFPKEQQFRLLTDVENAMTCVAGVDGMPGGWAIVIKEDERLTIGKKLARGLPVCLLGPAKVAGPATIRASIALLSPDVSIQRASVVIRPLETLMHRAEPVRLGSSQKVW